MAFPIQVVSSKLLMAWGSGEQCFVRIHQCGTACTCGPLLRPQRAKFCTSFRWFARPDKMAVEPHHGLPMSSTKLGFHFRIGSHSEPVERGRTAFTTAHVLMAF